MVYTITVGVLQRASTVGVPQRASTVGVLQRASTVGVLQRASTVGVLQRASTVGVLQRASTAGLISLHPPIDGVIIAAGFPWPGIGALRIHVLSVLKSSIAVVNTLTWATGRG